MSTQAPRDPLHGKTLEAILRELLVHYGWPGLAKRVEVRCFRNDPSIASSLKFLRRTPWARDQVEALYRDLCRKSGLARVNEKSKSARD